MNPVNPSTETVAKPSPEPPSAPSNFVRDIFLEDIKTKKFGDAAIQTRFPPEPNGYLHIGHAKAICLDFGLADEFGGKTNLRFDDTKPETAEQEYVDSIMKDVRWLGFEWDGLYYASDYFDQLYAWAIKLIEDGKAYIDDLSADEIRKYRGTLTEPGKDSPYRKRAVEENLDLFERMRKGEFPDGSRVLRAKIDMASPNLNMRAPRVMTGLRPLKVVIDNYPEGQIEEAEAVNNPEDESAGKRKVPFSKVLYIEQDDFREDPPKQYYRLSPGREVRLRYGYFITAKTMVKNARGEVVEVHCTYDPATRGGNSPDGRKVKSTIHWVSAAHTIDAEVRVYDKLFTKEDPNQVEEGQEFTANLNPNSLEVIAQAKLEPSLANAPIESRYQFERLGYFCVDRDSEPGRPVFNRTVALKDTWAKIERKSGP